MNSTIRLRAVEPSDADIFFKAENDESSWRDSDNIAPFSLHLLREYAENYRADPIADGQLRLVAADALTDAPVGILDFYEIDFIHSTAFIGIYVLTAERRKGFASEMIKEAEIYARRRLNLEILGAKILDVNHISCSLFEKAGYIHSGTLPQWRKISSGRSDLLIYTHPLTDIREVS